MQSTSSRLSLARMELLQTETGESSWFGFSMVLEEDVQVSRSEIVGKLVLRCRTSTIVAGNLFVTTIDTLIGQPPRVLNRPFAHQNGFFIGNHHDIRDKLDRFAQLIETGDGTRHLADVLDDRDNLVNVPLHGRMDENTTRLHSV